MKQQKSQRIRALNSIKSPGRAWLVLGFLVLVLSTLRVGSLYSAYAGRAAYAASPPSSTAAPSNPKIVPSPISGVPHAPEHTLSQSEAKTLLKEYSRSQKNQLKALEQQQKYELKELKASQAARQKEWELKEREARHEFFRIHSEGPERKVYVQDFLDRRKSLLSIFSEERSLRQKEQEVRHKAVKDEQEQKLKEFQDLLAHGERPTAALWPK